MSQTTRMKILIADDEPSIRLLVNDMLGKDYTILEANNGAEAIDVINLQRPDLILMDIMMPYVDGYTACSRIKTDQATKGIPVIMLTGVGHELNKKLSQEVGADGYITKPFRLTELREKIGELLNSKK